MATEDSTTSEAVANTTTPTREMTLTRKPSVLALYDSIVYIDVGPKAVRFGMHKELLSYQSEYFRACFESGFKEGTEGVVALDDEEPDTFKRFNAWLYTGNLLYDDETYKDLEYKDLFDVYVFAEKRIIPRLQNACVDAVISVELAIESLPVKISIKGLWERTSASSPMRRVMLDLYVRKGNMRLILEDPTGIHVLSKEFWASLVLAFYDAKKDRSILQRYNFWENRCQYHVHPEGAPKCT